MDLLTRVSSLRRRSTQNVAIYEPRDIYYLYKDEFGFPPKKANHLIQFAKQKDYTLKAIRAEQLLNDPPHPPKKRLPNGQYQWSDSDASSDDQQSDSSLSALHKNDKGKNALRSPMNSDFDKLKKTQLIAVGDLAAISEMREFVLSDHDINDITDDTLYDESGYYLTPFTDHIVLDFHLDIPTKQWPKFSRVFLGAINEALEIKRRDYNILTITNHEQEKLESRISILVRKFNSKWSNDDEKTFKSKIDKRLSPLKRTFKDSHHLLKMLKKLQFGDIDTSGDNQVDKLEFDAYFNANSVEPLDAQVLNNIFTTLDADGDGEITALEFFKWKTTFSSTKLTSMFPIINYKLCDFYKNCTIPRVKAALSQVQQHIYKRMQQFPFEFDIKHLFYINHFDKYKKFESFKGFEQSKLLFLIHKNGIGDHDINALLKTSINKKGKYFDDKGIYGQGYYLTSHLEYALNDIFYDETSSFKPRGHNVQLSSMDESESSDLTHGEYTVMVCLVNPGKINYIKDFHRSKKIKSADSNCVQRLIGDWNDEELFGRPESHYNDDGQQYYEGTVYDCYVVKNHERILPRYIITLRRQKRSFIWILKGSANKLIAARQHAGKFIPNIIYAADNIQKVLRTIRLKMQHNSVFLLRFVGIDVNVNSTMTAFIKYIKGNIENVKVKMYPITIIYNVETRKQVWNLIVRDHKTKAFSNVHGSPKQIFKHILDNLGGKKAMKMRLRRKRGNVSVIVMSIKFIKSNKEIETIMKQQMEDVMELEKEAKDDPIYDDDDALDKVASFDFDADFDESDSKSQEKAGRSFRIQITGANGHQKENEMKVTLEDESIDKLLRLSLPDQVSECLGDPKTYKLPEKDSEAMQNLERDMKKMSHSLHDQSRNQRKYSKLAVLKYYDPLCAVYHKYCKLGGDRHWLTMNGFLWMLHDAAITDKDDNFKQLFQITYKMHHRLQSRRSKHKIQLSAMYGDVPFNDDDPWTGIWKGTSANDNEQYKLRKIGDLRLSGCVNNIDYAHISGGYDSLNYKKAELEIKYFQRKRAGTKRIWKAELIAPTHMLDTIKMNVEWMEHDAKGKSSKAKSGTLSLKKTGSLSDNDKDLPKDEMIGLSRHEFFDLIISVSTTRFGIDYEYPFVCVDKLLSQHIDAYLYHNIMNSNQYSMANNEEVSKPIRMKGHILRKLFKYYSALDTDEAADDDGLGIEEWCTFALEICKTMKSFNKKIYKNGGQPNFEEMKAAFILSKGDLELDDEELDYPHFERCVVNLVNMMFKPQPNAKYKIMQFNQKLALMLQACDKLCKTNVNTKRDSTALRKIKTMHDRDGIPTFTPKKSNSKAKY